MSYIGRTIEKIMYFETKKELILLARELRKEMTRAEEILWLFLRNQKLNGVIFRPQQPIDIFVVDFYCRQYKLVIEVDGGIHEIPEIKERDENRTFELENLGLTVIRFTNDEIISETGKVLEAIKCNFARQESFGCLNK
jgi:very-short-patch-repair endonuclease